jgi:isopentenyl phosphate kinase
MLIFVKLGGSLITDKREAQHFHAETMARTAGELAAAYQSIPDLQLVIGHGSGSFGHVTATKYGTARGVATPAEWHGYAEVAVVARRLNNLVIEALAAAGLPVLPVSPSASARCRDGLLREMEVAPLQAALAHGLVPVVHGDVALDDQRGGTIVSTEAVFFYLAAILRPDQIFLLGEVEGVFDQSGHVITHITPNSLAALVNSLGGSHGTDVTGGMASKVQTMVDLAQRMPGLAIRIFGGTAPGQLERALRGEPAGTLITGG